MEPKNTDRQRQLIAGIAALIAGAVATDYIRNRANLEPYHTSALTGCLSLQELLEGHSERIVAGLGVTKEVFMKLCKELHELYNLQHS